MAKSTERELTLLIALKDQVSKPIQGIMKDFDNLEKAITAVTGIGVAFAGAAIGVGAFVDETLTALDEIHQLQNVTGVSADKIYELGKVAEVNGSSAQAAQNSIEGLSKVIGEAAIGVGKGAKAFENFGLKAKDSAGNIKSAETVLEELRVKMRDMDEAKQIAMLAKLGIDKTFIQTLRLADDEMNEMLETARALSLGVGNKDNAKIAADFKDALTLLQQAIKGTSEYLSLKLAPHLQEIIELFTDWFITNNDFVKESLDEIGNSIGQFLKFTFRMIQALDRVIQGTIGWRGALLLLIAVLAITRKTMIWAFITNPVTKMAFGILALILLIEDLIVYMNGGKSYFGDKWKPFIEIFAKIKTYFEQWKPTLQKVLGVLKEYAPIIAVVVAGVYSLMGVWLLISPVIGLATSAAKLFFFVLKAGILTNPIGLIITALVAVGVWIWKNWDTFSAFFIKLWEWVTQTYNEFLTFCAEIGQWFTDLGASIAQTWDNVWQAVNNFIEMVKAGFWGAVEKIKAFFFSIVETALGVYNKVAGFFGADPITIPVQVQTPAMPSVMQPSGAIGSAVSMAKTASATSATKPAGSIAPIKGATAKSFAPTNGKTVSNLTNNNQRTITNHITVNAQTNASPQQIANAIKTQAENRELS